LTLEKEKVVILIPVLGIIALLPFVFYLLAQNDVFFTKLETGDIKFIVRGDSLVRIIHDVRGKKLILINGEETLVDGKEDKTFINERFGLWWVGVPPFAKVHKFWIKPERENPSAQKKEQWITSDEPREVSSLRFTFPRPYRLDKVELSDRLSVDILVVAKFEVVKPQIPVFVFKGGFFANAGSILSADVADRVNNMTLDDFIKAQKGEVGGILKGMKASEESIGEELELKDTTTDSAVRHNLGDFNRELIRQVGLRLVGISITQFDPSDTEIRNAMQAKELAVKQGQARIASAEATKAARITEAEGEGQAIERLATAQGAQIRETVSALASTLGNPDVVAEQVGRVLIANARVLEAQAVAGPTSKITTWVNGGGGVQPALPISPTEPKEKKVKEDK
jgi:regulator of protease activity HflC (stomatin/prohibitin superfamily)